MAGPTRLELATSGVTGRRSNQLNYDPANIEPSGHRDIGSSIHRRIDASTNESRRLSLRRFNPAPENSLHCPPADDPMSR
jgi:hypothetical protein